jgi:catechol 1,2-dioxygenase
MALGSLGRVWTGREEALSLGEDAIGYIIYTQTGVMAVQISRRPRAPIAPNAVVDKKEYLAYFGRYWLDTEDAVIHHQLEQQLFPGIYPDDLKKEIPRFRRQAFT